MVIVMVVMMVIVLRNSHDAFDAADNAAGHATDHPSNRCANRTGGVPAFSAAMRSMTWAFGRASLTTLDNSLSLSGERRRKNDKNAKKACGHGQPVFHG